MPEQLWKCKRCTSVVGTSTGAPPTMCNICHTRNPNDWDRIVEPATRSTSIEDVLPDQVKRDIDEERKR